MSLAIYSRPGPRRVPFSELQICGCCLSNGDDALLSCAKCSVLVHAHCYYDENNDPSAWLCQPCSMLSPEERETIVCCICNQPGGALKATDDDGWAHVCCALWTPETYIPNGDLICGVTDIHVTRKSLRCTFCKKIGGCVQCSFGKCVTSFHLTCACQNGLQLSLENHDGTLVPISICHRHKQSTRKLVKAASVTSSANIREEEAICDVCGHDFVSENNDIVICDGCEIGVHQSCYGIASIPEHQWFCQACSSERPGKCILCSDSEGALKQTTNGDWVHVVCALWSHQAYFLKPSSLDALTGLEHLLLDDPDRQCHFCKDAAGFCCDCAAAGCSNFFHVRCARKDKRRVEIYDLENPSSPLNVLPQLSSLQSQAQLAFVVFCDIHQTAPFSAVDYQKDHPFPSFDNGVNSDNEVLDFSTSPPTENDIRKSRKRFTNAFVDDGKRSQADIFWQDEIQPYFEPPRISALRLSKSLERKMDVSFIMPPLGKISARLYHPCLPSFKSCDWICEQLDIPCVNAQRYYALLRRDNSAIFTNFQPNGTLLNFCLVENVPPDGDLFYELSNQQHLLASQLFELDGFRKKLRTTIDTSFVDCTKNQRDIAALHKDYVDMSHSQIVRLSLVSGFRDLDLAASDFTQEHFNTTCRVCFGTEGTEVNPIVICESCGLAVHKYCYGIEFIPEGDWLCDACSGTSCPVATRECALCPLNGFAFKSCDIEGLTVHLVCALWCPQVQIIDMVKMAPVTNVLQALSSPHADCGICRHDGGITVSCCHLGCFHQFHVTCAWEFGLFMEVKSVEGKPLFNCFCVSHTPEKAGGQQRDRLKQHELRLKARTQKPAQAYRPAESALDNTFSMVSASATPRVLDGEDTYLPDVCAVCFTFSQDDLVKCVNCSIAIHPDCYGTPKNAEQFRCVRCTAQPQRARKISCVYCPRLGGAYERHETSRWRHKACERWALSYRNNGDRLFHHTVCAICDRKEGACIACTANGCSAKFHALCGLFVHCYLHFEDDVLTALCPLHSPIRSDSFNGKDASPDLFVFYDRLRLVRADLDELRTIMDLVKRREKVKKNISALYLQIASEAKSIGKMSPPRDHFGESEEKDVDYMARKAPSGLLEVVLEEDTENGEISCDEIMMLNQNKCSPKSSPISPDRASLDVADGSVVLEDAEQIDESIFFESTTVNPSIDLRLKDLGASNECDNSRIPCQSRENQTVPVSTMNGEGDASEPAVESTSKNDDNTSVQGVGADVSDHREGSSGRAEDAGGDESSDDESKKLAHRDSVDDKPRSRRKAEASSDELEDDEALDSNEPRQKRLVTVEKRPRIGKSAIQFRIKIDRSQLPPSSKVKIKKALLSARSKPSSRGRRLSRSSRQTSSGDESAIISDGSDVEATVRRGRRRSARGTVDSDMDDFTSENVTPARRYTQRTASLAERRAKDSEEASESTNLNRIRWFPDEIEYLNEIVEDLDIDPDWDVVAKMMEDKFGQTFRVYSKNVVQTRWSRSSLGHSRKAVPAAPVVESTSQRTRWPNEELEFLRSLVAHGNDEGKRNWPDIVKQMHRKFGRLYRRYTHQVLQSKVHRLLNTPESSEPKESTRKAAKSSSKSKWANEELEYLRGLVTKFGTDDWVTVANFMDKYLGERYRTYTGPILQKRWRELGPRGQAGPSQEIRDDMVANPEQHAAASPQIDNGHASDNNQEELISEEDFEEALSDGELEHPRTVLKSPVIAAPDDSEMYEEPASAPAELTSPSASDSVDSSAVLNVSAETSNAAEIPASTSEPNQSKAVALKPENSSDTSAAVHTSSMTGSIKKDLLSEPSGIPIEDHESTPTENPAENAMDLDAGPGHVELRSPLAQPAQPLQQPPDLSQTFEETQHTLAGNLSSEPNATRDAEDKFEEEVPWHLEPDEDNVVLRTPMQQASLLFAQSTDDSLFASSFPSYILNQGDVSSDQPKPKGNAWRPDEIDYLNELGSNPSLNKDWELIASKMCDRFGTQYRKGYLAASIKQRWSKANPRTPKSGPATATPTVPRAVTSFKDSRQSFTSRDARGPEPVAVSTDDQNLAKEQSEGLSRTPYNQEELDYLAELVDQFGSKDWTRVAQRMQLRFNDKYRRYVAASLSGKWTRLRSKNQLPANDSESAAGETAPSSEALRLASHFPPESTIHVPDSELLVEPAVEETVEDAIPCSSATPIVEEPDEVPQVVVPKSPLYDQPQAQLDATLVQPLSPVPKNYQDLSSASEQLQSQEINAEPTPSNDFSTVRSAAAPKTRGKTPWSEEEVTFFRTQLLELGKDFKAILPKMTAKFGAAYRQYTLSSLQARWSKMEKFENISPTDVSPMQTADERGLPAVISTHQRSQEEITPAEDHFEIAECTIEAASSKLESRDNVLEEDVVLESPSRRRRSRDEDFDADAQESSKESRRSRRRRAEVSESPPRSSSNGTPTLGLDENLRPGSPVRVRSPRVSQSPTPVDIAVSNAVETSTELEAEVPQSSRMTPSSSRTKAPWLPDELQYLRLTAQKEKFEWNCVAREMNQKFGTERRPKGYTPIAVMTIYRRRFPKDGAPARIKDAPATTKEVASSGADIEEKEIPFPRPKAIKQPKSRGRPAKTLESSNVPHVDLPTTTQTTTQSPDGLGGRTQPSRRAAPSPGRNRTSLAKASPTKRRLLSNETAAIEKLAAVIESDVDSSKAAPRRRRRTELPPSTTPKRRKMSVPGTEPRKPGPSRSRIPNQGVNRLSRLIENIEEHEFPGDQSSKALKFLRSHQSKWKQSRALAPGDRAWVLDSWQFKPYEIKIVQAYDEGDRYRIHYLNWSSKFDEDVSGEFVFQHSPEIRQISSMADTYSKGR